MDTPHTKATRSVAERIFLGADGKVVIYQHPNLPLIAALASAATAWLAKGRWHEGLTAFAFGSLFTWAWMEIFQGVNFFRRTLGVIGIAALLYMAIFHLV